MPFVSSLRGTFGPTSENKGVAKGQALGEYLRQDPNSLAAPQGGTITNVGGYRIHTFTTSGTTTSTQTFSTVNYGQSLSVEYLVVGGGGGGGNTVAGAGGGGGYLTGSVNVPAGSYSVQIGGGGTQPGPNRGDTVAGKGGSSIWNGITSFGGGYGASYDNIGANVGGPFGSGGGGADRNDGQSSHIRGEGTPGQGFPGGYGARHPDSTSSRGGGGGGAAGAGNPGVNDTSVPGFPGSDGSGGAGVANSITGTSVVYAGGGDAGGHNGGPGGGAGGPNPAGWTPNPALNGFGGQGTDNVGGGGGGGSHPPDFAGGRGGTGIVVIRYIP